jgi:Hint domain
VVVVGAVAHASGGLAFCGLRERHQLLCQIDRSYGEAQLCDAGAEPPSKRIDDAPRWTLPPARGFSPPCRHSLIDGVLVPAELLINGTTITRDQRHVREYDELEFLHVKLESHDVIYAEGVPAETLINVQESAVNFADYLRRYGTAATDEEHCAPHIHIWGGRVELASRFRSAISPWIDLRNQADVVRDRLEERGVMLSRQAELAH